MNSYEREPYRVSIETRVVRVTGDGKRSWAVLEDTVLYPEGGGQPADHGWIDGIPVNDVQRVDEQIRHYLDGALSAETATVEVDWARRYDHMQQHTAQHLLSALAHDRLGWETTSFHLGPTTCDIELDVPRLAPDDLDRLEEEVAERVRAALPVTARRVGADEYASLDVRTRGLPEGHRGDIRLVEIAGVDCAACGGTHLANTAEIESVVLLDTEPMRGGTRLHWIAGGRVRRRLHARERQTAAVRHLFETSDEELLGVAGAKLERLDRAERQLRRLREQLARELARGLLDGPASPVDGHFDDADAGFLRLVARELLAANDPRVALLTGTDEGSTYFCLCAAPASGVDVRAIAPRVVEVLEGRGGGSSELVQGKAGSLAQRQRALEILADAAPS